MLNDYYKAIKCLDEIYSLELSRVKEEVSYRGPLPYLNDSYQNYDEEMTKLWTNSMKERFYYIYRTYIKAGKDRELYSDRLKIEFPELTRKQIDEYDRVVLSKEQARKRRKALYRDWNREKIDLKNKLQSQVKSLIAQSLTATQKELERVQLVNPDSIR